MNYLRIIIIAISNIHSFPGCTPLHSTNPRIHTFTDVSVAIRDCANVASIAEVDIHRTPVTHGKFNESVRTATRGTSLSVYEIILWKLARAEQKKEIFFFSSRIDQAMM